MIFILFKIVKLIIKSIEVTQKILEFQVNIIKEIM
jgi:hypothetical protein